MLLNILKHIKYTEIYLNITKNFLFKFTQMFFNCQNKKNLKERKDMTYNVYNE